MAPVADPPLFEEQSSYWEAPKKPWSVQKSSQLYRVEGWGAPYFKINAYGNIAVRPQGGRTGPNDEIDLMKTISKVVTGKDSISMPLIIRFPDILKNRMETLQSAFDAGIKRQSYSGTFQGVFPVKCNPDRYLVEEIVSYGRHMNFGLEAGSKPELLLVMAAMCKASGEAFVICNGYKDGEYVEMALIGRRMGLRTVIVLEQVEELETVLMLSKRLQIQPVIGVRAKLSTKHAGHWGDTSGEKGKFGLSACEIVQVVRRLRKVSMLDCLQLLHFHIGSQIPSLALVRGGVSEAAHIFCELALMGANMSVIDIGGGLGVDYDGTRSSQSEMSIGYNIEEYADTVVEAIKDATSQKHVKQPVLCCESGRALVSHHAVLVFDVLSAHKSRSCINGHDRGIRMKIEGLPAGLVHLQDELVRCIGIGNYEGAVRCAWQLRFQCSDLFKAGLLGLEVHAAIDEMLEIVSACADRKENQGIVSSYIEKSCGERPGSRESSKGEYFSTYHINLSIFKSMPDSWAIGQLFPIVPIHRLETEPKERVILSDITCDSDGKVTTFIGSGKYGEAAKHLCAHELEEGKPYYMGMFLGGAYQEVLGSTHNLFGNPNVVHVVPSRGGDGFIISKFLPGQSLSCTLRAMHHDPKMMFDDLKHRVDNCVLDGMLGKVEAMSAMSTLATSFHSYTYLYSEAKKVVLSFAVERSDNQLVSSSRTISSLSYRVHSVNYC